MKSSNTVIVVSATIAFFASPGSPWHMSYALADCFSDCPSLDAACFTACKCAATPGGCPAPTCDPTVSSCTPPPNTCQKGNPTCTPPPPITQTCPSGYFLTAPPTPKPCPPYDPTCTSGSGTGTGSAQCCTADFSSCVPPTTCQPGDLSCNQTLLSDIIEILTLNLQGTTLTSLNPACTTCGKPVNLPSGAMFHPMLDFTVAGRTAATGIALRRIYLSMTTLKAPGDFGPHWAHNWETKLIIASTQTQSAPSALDQLCASMNVGCSKYSDGAVAANCAVVESRLVCFFTAPSAAQEGLVCGIPEISCMPFKGSPPLPQPDNCRVLPDVIACVTPGSSTTPPTSTTTAGDIVWIDETGGGWRFVRQADGSLKAPPGVFSTLTEFSDHFELRKKGGVTLTYAKSASALTPTGALLSIAEPHGEKVSLNYVSGKLASIINPFTGTISFVRDSAGRITRINRERDGSPACLPPIGRTHGTVVCGCPG